MLSVTEDKYFIKDLVCFLLITMFHKLSSAHALLLLLKLNLKSVSLYFWYVLYSYIEGTSDFHLNAI